MKKLTALLLAIVYIISTNSIIHLVSMGFLGHEDNHKKNIVTHCNSTQAEDEKKTKSNIDCCELVLSHNFYQSQINLQQIKYTFNIINQQTNFKTIYQDVETNYKKRNFTGISPGPNIFAKFNKFSDFVGIIVKVI